MASRKLIIGCGYLGRRVARRWLAQRDAVFALTRSAERAGEFQASGIVPIVGDVTDPASLATIPDVETALYAVGLDRASGKSMREVYVGGLENVLNHLVGKVRKFLYISQPWARLFCGVVFPAGPSTPTAAEIAGKRLSVMANIHGDQRTADNFFPGARLVPAKSPWDIADKVCRRR